ncbi:L-rhamnose mutarotase [Saccharopolyspora sp. K220]|uniref:L-rhamnose mutarotase n=1 Tax=Saccharopolyspora soli TaxID=2926618 RepID=UPI001F571610|nr:L-rhamnose mutarotase [Saccharopolyspora soli]MCI2419517.1 L-rhamnose mutarotase [Saccharopolyspora soli]
MPRICFVLQVKPDRIDEYRERHRHVWSEMRRALSEAGWQNYSLFLRPDGMLIGYLECEDFEACRAAMAATEVNARWQTEMSEFFTGNGDSAPDAAMQPIEEIFHLDGR